MHRSTYLAISLFFAVIETQAQTLKEKIVTDSEAKLYRMQGDTSPIIGGAGFLAPAYKYSASLGLSYTDYDEGARSVSTPFQVAYSPTAWFTAGLQGAGFTKGREPSKGDIEGWNENRLYANFFIPNGVDIVTFGLGLKIPAKGETDTRNYQQTVSLSYEVKSTVWQPAFKLFMRRATGTVTEGASRAYYGSLGVGRDLEGKRRVSIAVERFVARETDSLTSAVGTFTFPIKPEDTNSPNGKLSLTRDFTEGSRSFSMEFLVTKKF